LGGSSYDFINGGSENDNLWGLDGNDVLIGGFGNDTLVGGNGDDHLNGYGNTVNNDSQFDKLNGGAGKDTFLLGSANNVFYNETGDGYAVITDFSRLDDKIQLKGNASQYKLEFNSVSGVGSTAKDAEVYFLSGGNKERIGIVQDVTNVTLASNFKFV